MASSVASGLLKIRNDILSIFGSYDAQCLTRPMFHGLFPRWLIFSWCMSRIGFTKSPIKRYKLAGQIIDDQSIRC